MDIPYINKNTAPYDIPGRWYKFSVSSDGSAYHMDSADIPTAKLETGFITLPVGYHAVDIRHDVHSVPGHSQVVANRIRFNSDGSQSVPLPNANVLDYADIYIFAHRRD